MIYPFGYPIWDIQTVIVSEEPENKRTHYQYLSKWEHIIQHTWYKDFDTEKQSGLVIDFFKNSCNWEMGKSWEKENIWDILMQFGMRENHIQYFEKHLQEHKEFLQYILESGYILKKFFLRDNLPVEIFEKEYEEIRESENLHAYFTEPLLVLYFVHENGNHFCVELHSSECAF